ncbi:hypothetical protein CGRA01v4_00938 [Colletotrichum graminicola]|uniref:Uncharacterized protein n=1 Tax=Colletotrichum graminicola (strain M1.001 / M2 / FGSC 10212) TaxID=645133 RepID=E3QH05_COLGM|nr:uncharacterized protein GLRG_05287 [Colletotrichum graminicola M1.001]EFQ30143.1 hypothetical protein GLRG_05287 [Colletotrichum graminicola M1.001]WDK09660.1 hypothetical protein CGRA01v4_00938 [Colletotrichum graminicola]
MSRKGKERERDYRHAFRPGAEDPALWSREEDEEADWNHQPDGQAWAVEPNPALDEWAALHQATSATTSQSFGYGPGL